MAVAIPAGPPPTTTTSDCIHPAFLAPHQHTLHHRKSTSSEQNPGPMAASILIVPGAGLLCIYTSSSTSSTDVEEMLPTLRRQFHDASRSFDVSPSATSVASSTFGPPVCITQLLMSLRFSPCSPRNSSTSPPRCFTTVSGTSGDSTMRKPFSEISQPITLSVLG